MKHPRFTLRALLVLVTIAAVGLSFWRVAYVKRKVNEDEVKWIELGHRQWQVRLLLGPPHTANGGAVKTTWSYEIDRTPDIVYLQFERGHLVLIERVHFFPPGPELRGSKGSGSAAHSVAE